MAEKLTGRINVLMSPALELDLRRMAEDADRSPTDFCRMILSKYVYGNRTRLFDPEDGNSAPEDAT